MKYENIREEMKEEMKEPEFPSQTKSDFNNETEKCLLEQTNAEFKEKQYYESLMDDIESKYSGERMNQLKVKNTLVDAKTKQNDFTLELGQRNKNERVKADIHE